MNKSNYIIIIIAICVLFIFDFIQDKKIKKHKEEIENTNIKIDSLETRVATFETLYRSHLEECSFISKNNIRVGHNNYLQKIN